MVVDVGAGSVNGEPLATNVPPQLPVYHLRVVPDPPTAVNVMLPDGVPQKDVTELVAEVGATGVEPTVTTTDAQLLPTQPVVELRARA